MKKVKPTSERYVQRQVILFLRRFGWLVINTSGAWKAARGMVGFPDVIAFKSGVTLLIECKAFGAGLRVGQEKFRKKIIQQLHDTLNYRVVHAGEFEDFVQAMKNIYTFNEFAMPLNFGEWRPKL